MEGDGSLVMETVSLEDPHPVLLMVQTKVFTPTITPVTVEAGFDGEVTVAVPAITVHVPVPTAGVLPASVATESQTF